MWPLFNLTCLRDIWRRRWHPTPVLLPGKSHGQRSLVGCGPWGREESDMTEQLPFHFSLSCIGEGNGNPLQCSRLENPRDGGAWWAAVYGVTQSRTRLKWLSSSIVMVSTIHQFESATGIYVSLSSWTPSYLPPHPPSLNVVTQHRLGCPVSYPKLPLVILFYVW